MARSHISPSNATNKTINAIDRKREQERRFLLIKARDNAPELATSLVQRLLDEQAVGLFLRRCGDAQDDPHQLLLGLLER